MGNLLRDNGVGLARNSAEDLDSYSVYTRDGEDLSTTRALFLGLAWDRIERGREKRMERYPRSASLPHSCHSDEYEIAELKTSHFCKHIVDAISGCSDTL